MLGDAQIKDQPTQAHASEPTPLNGHRTQSSMTAQMIWDRAASHASEQSPYLSAMMQACSLESLQDGVAVLQLHNESRRAFVQLKLEELGALLSQVGGSAVRVELAQSSQVRSITDSKAMPNPSEEDPLVERARDLFDANVRYVSEETDQS